MELKALILLATFNGERYLREQIDSILAQENVSLRVVAHDDGSTDGTVGILNEYQARHPNFFLLCDNITCGSAAKNFRHLILNVNASTDEAVFFADQDDIWLPSKVYQACKCVSVGVDLYSSALGIYSSAEGVTGILKPRFNPKKYDFLFQGLSAGCTYALSTRLFMLVKRFISDAWFRGNDFSHDWLIYSIARSHDCEIFHDQNHYIWYRQHGSNVQGAARGLKGILYRIKNINTGWYAEQIFWNTKLLANDSDDYRIVKAFEHRQILTLIGNVTKLRRSLIESVALVIFSMLRERRK